jgi:hypothetical protein
MQPAPLGRPGVPSMSFPAQYGATAQHGHTMFAVQLFEHALVGLVMVTKLLEALSKA